MEAKLIDSFIVSRLNAGDRVAAEQVFLIYEPFLRMVVRRRLSAGMRAKFESVDIVQSVWADLWDGFRRAKWNFRDAQHLRAFLVKATLNRFIDRVRQHRQPLMREHGRSSVDLDMLAITTATPSENVGAEELWGRMLASCPSEHQEVLRLKRQGFAVSEIAARVGLHESSVRRILLEIRRLVMLKQGDLSATNQPAIAPEVLDSMLCHDSGAQPGAAH